MVQGLEKAEAFGILHTNRVPESVFEHAVQLSSVAKNDWRSDDDHKDEKHEEVENSEANHTSLAKLGLLERIDGRADLSAKSNQG